MQVIDRLTHGATHMSTYDALLRAFTLAFCAGVAAYAVLGQDHALWLTVLAIGALVGATGWTLLEMYAVALGCEDDQDQDQDDEDEDEDDFGRAA